MRGRHRHVIDKKVEENLDDDVYMYLVTCTDERHAYRVAIRASKAIEWNRQQEEHFVRGESSHPTNPTRHMQRLQSVQYSDPSPPNAPSFHKSLTKKTKYVKNLFKGGAIKKTIGCLISKFFI
ncbi:hypothetical protein AAG906_039436 [Vitis piasezkii]